MTSFSVVLRSQPPATAPNTKSATAAYRKQVRPFHGEAASSFFSRLLPDECWLKPEEYAQDLGISVAFDSDELLETIAMLPIPESAKQQLRHWPPLELPQSVVICGSAFRKRHFSWSRRLTCAACLEDRAYHRVWWHLDCYRRCPRQAIPLTPVPTPSLSGRWWPQFEAEKGDVENDMTVPNYRSFESFVARSLARHPEFAEARVLPAMIDGCEFLGRLLGNQRQHSFPNFRNTDWQLGYEALRD